MDQFCYIALMAWKVQYVSQIRISTLEHIKCMILDLAVSECRNAECCAAGGSRCPQYLIKEYSPIRCRFSFRFSAAPLKFCRAAARATATVTTSRYFAILSPSPTCSIRTPVVKRERSKSGLSDWGHTCYSIPASTLHYLLPTTNPWAIIDAFIALAYTFLHCRQPLWLRHLFTIAVLNLPQQITVLTMTITHSSACPALCYPS